MISRYTGKPTFVGPVRSKQRRNQRKSPIIHFHERPSSSESYVSSESLVSKNDSSDHSLTETLSKPTCTKTAKSDQQHLFEFRTPPCSDNSDSKDLTLTNNSDFSTSTPDQQLLIDKSAQQHSLHYAKSNNHSGDLSILKAKDNQKKKNPWQHDDISLESCSPKNQQSSDQIPLISSRLSNNEAGPSATNAISAIFGNGSHDSQTFLNLCTAEQQNFEHDVFPVPCSTPSFTLDAFSNDNSFQGFFTFTVPPSPENEATS